MKIRRLVEQLKNELQKEYGVKADISIDVHSTDNQLSFGQANNIANNLLGELGGKKRLAKCDDILIMGNDYEYKNEPIANLNIFPEVIFDEK